MGLVEGMSAFWIGVEVLERLAEASVGRWTGWISEMGGYAG